jgi:hypothetical protein
MRSPIRLTESGAYVFGLNFIPALLWERLPEQHRNYRVVRRVYGWVVVKAGRATEGGSDAAR